MPLSDLSCRHWWGRGVQGWASLGLQASHTRDAFFLLGKGRGASEGQLSHSPRTEGLACAHVSVSFGIHSRAGYLQIWMDSFKKNFLIQSRSLFTALYLWDLSGTNSPRNTELGVCLCVCARI